MTITTFKTLTLGKSSAYYRKTLKKAGITVSSYADELLNKMPPVKGDVDTVVLSVADLGFPNGSSYRDICVEVLKQGLELCPVEVGPALRLAYTDQSKYEYLRIAMNPIADSDGRLGIFKVGHDGDGLWLYWSDGYPDYFWDASFRFVFVRPRKPSDFGTVSSSDILSSSLRAAKEKFSKGMDAVDLPETLEINGVVYKKV